MWKLSIITNGGVMFKNSMRAVHPGEVLREDYLLPLNMSANAIVEMLLEDVLMIPILSIASPEAYR